MRWILQLWNSKLYIFPERLRTFILWQFLQFPVRPTWPLLDPNTINVFIKYRVNFDDIISDNFRKSSRLKQRIDFGVLMNSGTYFCCTRMHLIFFATESCIFNFMNKLNQNYGHITFPGFTPWYSSLESSDYNMTTYNFVVGNTISE